MTSTPNIPDINVDEVESNNKSSRISESPSRPSFESTYSASMSNTTFTGTNRFPFSMSSKSGSVDYSPLGNNSIYEIVMNTRRKNWLQPPTTMDIPPVTLSKNDMDDNWKSTIDNYVNDISEQDKIFRNTNNLKNINQLEQARKLNVGNDIGAVDEREGLSAVDEEGTSVLNEIPDFFFESVFQLDNERTFNKVLDSVDLKAPTLTVSDKSIRDESYLQLKEKLNDHLDVVETLLVTEISKSSQQFFYALSEVETIKEKANTTVEGLQELSVTLKDVDRETNSQKIENAHLTMKRKNVEKLEQGLLQVKLVLTKVAKCKELFNYEHFDECMEMLHSIDGLIRGDRHLNTTVESWVSGWPYDLIDLKSIPALVETREFLTNMKIEIGGKYSMQLSDLLLSDLRSSYENIDIKEVILFLQSNHKEKKKQLFDDEFQDFIKELVLKLNRCEELASSFKFYQDKATVEVKSIIKKYLPHEVMKREESSSSIIDKSRSITPSLGVNSASTMTAPPQNSGGSKLSTLLKEQTPLEFQNLLEEVFAHELEALKRLYLHQKLLLDISLRVINVSEMTSENQHNMIAQLDIRTYINEMIRIVQLRMGKVIAVRRDLTSTLRHDHFLKLYSICVLFIQECEALSGEFLTKYLSDVLASQIKHYITLHDSKNIRTIQKKIELENWVPFIVNPSIQTDVNDIISSIDIDPIDWTNILILSSDQSESQDDKDNDTNVGSENKTGNRKSVVVGDKTFVASDSLLAAIDIIKELLILSINLPAIYLPYFERMCFNILKYFNSYSLAKITRQEGMSNNTKIYAPGKNLSIMGETIDCLTEFVTIVQSFYQRLATTSKDFTPYEPGHYSQLLQQYRDSSEKIYQAHAPPPPM